jgi:hypothetical protein
MASSTRTRIRTPQGIRYIDHLIQDEAGYISAVEVKAGDAVRNASQVAKDNSIATQGGTFTGEFGSTSLGQQLSGVPIPTTVIQIMK